MSYVELLLKELLAARRPVNLDPTLESAHLTGGPLHPTVVGGRINELPVLARVLAMIVLNHLRATPGVAFDLIAASLPLLPATVLAANWAMPPSRRWSAPAAPWSSTTKSWGNRSPATSTL